MPSTIEEARNILSNFARTEWESATTAAGFSGAPLSYDNLDFDPPNAPWGRLSVKHNEMSRASLGSATALFRRTGMLSLQIFIPIGLGTLPADRIADPLVQAFEVPGQTDNIWFRNARVREIGPDGTYYQTNFQVEFVWDRTA